MATLQCVSNEAENRGYTDAYYGRVHQHSLTDYYKGLGLADIYERGWKGGKNRRAADNRAADRGVWDSCKAGRPWLR